MAVLGLEVAPDPAPKRLRLADVENFATNIPKQVASRLCGNLLKLRCDLAFNCSVTHFNWREMAEGACVPHFF